MFNVKFNVNTTKIVALFALLCMATLRSAAAEQLHGSIGKDTRWESGWIDISPTNLYKGDELRILVGGTASKILVRLLDDIRRADSPEGVLGIYQVTKDRTVRVPIDSDRKGVQQISVHGGKNPFGMYDLGQNNGPATLSDVQIIRAGSKAASARQK